MSKDVPNFKPADRLVSAREMRSWLGIGHTTLYALCKDEKFPRRRRIGKKKVAWLASEVSDWIASREAA